MAADNFFAQIKVTTRLIKPTVGFEPTTTGLQNRCTKNVSAEKTKTCEAAETQLTPQLTPNSPKQDKTRAIPLSYVGKLLDYYLLIQPSIINPKERPYFTSNAKLLQEN